MKIVNLFTICILLSEMLLQVLTIRVKNIECSSYNDQEKCYQNKCLWITNTKTCKILKKKFYGKKSRHSKHGSNINNSNMNEASYFPNSS